MASININLAFICDDTYALCTGVAISSLLRHRNKNRLYRIYILANHVSARHIELFHALKVPNFDVEVVDVSQNDVYANYDRMRYAPHVSATALFKFNLPEVLSSIDKVLYMDGDILIRDDLEALYDMELGDCYAGVCKDIGAESFPSPYNERLHIKHVSYFNSGVMLLNLKLMREESISQKLLEYKINGINHYMDQDAFNVVFEEKVKFFSPMYNMAVSCWRKTSAEEFCDYYDIKACSIEQLFVQANVLHLSAPEKPWIYNNVIASEEWLLNFIQSPWNKLELYRVQHAKGLNILQNGCDYSKVLTQIIPMKKCAKPLVSVIIPVYNASRYLSACVESLMTQTISDAEFIFIDDGSTDCSIEILQYYAKLDHRIQVWSQINGYAAAARNNGLCHAIGKYITFLDSDDIMLPMALEQFYKTAIKTNADIVVSSAFFFEEDISIRQTAEWCLREKYLPHTSTFSIKTHSKYLFQISSGAPWGKFYKADFVRKNQFYFPSLPRAEDMFFVYWAFAVAETIAILNDKTVLYRICAGNGSLEDAKDNFPLASIKSRKLLWKKLNEIGVYDSVKQSFINGTINGVVYHLRTFRTGDAFEQMYRAVREEIIPLFAIELADASYFYNKNEYKYFKEVFDSKSCVDYWFLKSKELLRIHKSIQSTEPSNATELDTKSLAQQVDFYKKQANGYKYEIKTIRNSWSYRMGRIITWFPRKIRGCIRCCQEHGFQYTFLRVLKRLKSGVFSVGSHFKHYNAKSTSSISKKQITAPLSSAVAKKDYDFYATISPALYERELELWYKKETGEELDLANPKTFNEKIQWLKLYDSTPLKTRLADKYLVREWVAAKIGEEYLVPLLGVWDNFDEIDFDKLPKQFALKTNHGSGWNLIVRDKDMLDHAAAKKKFDGWLQKNFAFVYGLELHYMNIPAKIIAEKYMENMDQVYDYKFMCFNGEVKFIWVDTDRFTNHHRTCFDLGWHRIPVTVGPYVPTKFEIPCPKNFEKMKAFATILSQSFSHVRVDFYEVDGKLYFGEMTFTSTSGTDKIVPHEFDVTLGDMLVLPPKSPLPERKF